MDTILKFIFNEDSIKNSKLILLYSIVINCIFTNYFYCLFNGNYDIVFDLKHIINFLLNGNFLIIVLIYLSVYFITNLLEIAFFFEYIFRIISKAQKKNNIKYENTNSINEIIKFAGISKKLLSNMSFSRKVNGIIKINEFIIEEIKDYIENPKIIVINLITIIVLILKTFIIIFLIKDTWTCGIFIGCSIIIIIVVCIIRCFINIFAHIEVNISNIEKFVKDIEQQKEIQIEIIHKI